MGYDEYKLTVFIEEIELVMKGHLETKTQCPPDKVMAYFAKSLEFLAELVDDRNHWRDEHRRLLTQYNQKWGEEISKEAKCQATQKDRPTHLKLVTRDSSESSEK